MRGACQQMQRPGLGTTDVGAGIGDARGVAKWMDGWMYGLVFVPALARMPLAQPVLAARRQARSGLSKE